MFAELPYRLTEYTDFRQLEFAHSQLKDDHAALAAKLSALQHLYRQALAQQQAQRRQALSNEAGLEATAQEAQAKLSDLLAFAEGIHGEIRDVARVGIDLGAEFELPRGEAAGGDRMEEAKWVFGQLLRCLMVAVSRNNELALRMEKEGGHLRAELREHKRREGELRAEISYLSEELQRLEASGSALLGEVGVLKRENLEQRAQLQECGRRAQEESVLSERDGHIEDSSFALDLLSHDKELLERIFARVLSSLPEQPALALADIYGCYEAVAEAFREKLQVEYDLEDLEREYKREKNSRVAEGLLIELRKQIENFRSELHRQREALGRQEQQLEQHFADLEARGREEQRTRNYTLDVEKRLREAHSLNATKRNAPEAQSSRIQFRATAKAEEAMREEVRRDRENIERVFRETRSQLGRQ